MPESAKIDNLPGSNYYPGVDLLAAIDAASIDAASIDFGHILATAARVKCEECPRFSIPCTRSVEFSSLSLGNLLLDPQPVLDANGDVTGYNIYMSFFGDYRVKCAECANSIPE